MPSAHFRVEDPQAPRRAVDPWFKATADAIMRDARSATPVRTGNLRAGWRTVKAGRNASYRVVNDVYYSVYVEFGTRYMAPRGMLGQAVARNRGRG